jgi:hypothetical protein
MRRQLGLLLAQQIAQRPEIRIGEVLVDLPLRYLEGMIPLQSDQALDVFRFPDGLPKQIGQGEGDHALVGLVLHLGRQQLDLPPYGPLRFLFMARVVTENRKGQLTRHHESRRIG